MTETLPPITADEIAEIVEKSKAEPERSFGYTDTDGSTVLVKGGEEVSRSFIEASDAEIEDADADILNLFAPAGETIVVPFDFTIKGKNKRFYVKQLGQRECIEIDCKKYRIGPLGKIVLKVVLVPNSPKAVRSSGRSQYASPACRPKHW